MAVPDGWRNHTARRTSAEVDPPLISGLRGAGPHGGLHANKQRGEEGEGREQWGQRSIRKPTGLLVKDVPTFISRCRRLKNRWLRTETHCH